jgi:hypothetical protein
VLLVALVDVGGEFEDRLLQRRDAVEVVTVAERDRRVEPPGSSTSSRRPLCHDHGRATRLSVRNLYIHLT